MSLVTPIEEREVYNILYSKEYKREPVPSVHITVPSIHITVPSVHITVPSVHITVPSVHITVPSVQLHSDIKELPRTYVHTLTRVPISYHAPVNRLAVRLSNTHITMMSSLSVKITIVCPPVRRYSECQYF